MQSSGGIAHLGLSVSPLAAGGEREGVVCLLADLTPLRELEEQLRLKEALARLGELTAGIAHEFRNGLATIHGYSRLLRPDALPEAYRPYVDGIRQEAEALGHVMTNFLKFARPDQAAFAARGPARRGPARRSTTWRTSCRPGPTCCVEGTFAPVEGDEVLLRQVFGNLIRNAAEACAGRRCTPMVRVRGSADERACRVAVDDNGPGIPEDARTRVFEPFFTTRSRGTGLGLAIVQKVVVTHNGRVIGRAFLARRRIHQHDVPAGGRLASLPRGIRLDPGSTQPAAQSVAVCSHSCRRRAIVTSQCRTPAACVRRGGTRPWLAACSRHACRPVDSAGFSLIETLVAALVFSVGVVGVMPLIAGAVRATRGARDTGMATWLAWQKAEELRGPAGALAAAAGGDVDHLDQFGRNVEPPGVYTRRWTVDRGRRRRPPHRGRRAPRVGAWRPGRPRVPRARSAP